MSEQRKIVQIATDVHVEPATKFEDATTVTKTLALTDDGLVFEHVEYDPAANDEEIDALLPYWRLQMNLIPQGTTAEIVEAEHCAINAFRRAVIKRDQG